MRGEGDSLEIIVLKYMKNSLYSHKGNRCCPSKDSGKIGT